MRKHYLKDGTVFKGGIHKMPNGQIHSGKTHTKSSKRVKMILSLIKNLLQ